jgi:RNA polymerase sigma-70 factor, ECF subfamily
VPNTITGLLHAWNSGDRSALDRLLPHVYAELRAIAARALTTEREDPISPTELVHEFFLRIRNTEDPHWRDRVHFYGAAAGQMRRVLVDLARRRNAAKRREPLRIHIDVPGREPPDLEALDAAMDRLAELKPRQAQLVELRFFGGLSSEEAADYLGISASTAKREWLAAKAWLLKRLRS